MVMGDIVLLEDQVNPVMSVALDNGLEVTALHNHFFWDTPKVMFMHIGGMGDETELAAAVGKVFAKIKETSRRQRREVPRPTSTPRRPRSTPAKIDAVLGAQGRAARTASTRSRSGDDHEDARARRSGKAMGVNTWAAFAGSDEKAVVDGDFAMLEGELQAVLKALRGAGIDIVAIHNHMTGESPRIMFLHYWGVGRAAELAPGAAVGARRPGRGGRAAVSRAAADPIPLR